MKPDIRIYEKALKGGFYHRRRVVLINFITGKLLYLADTEDEPNVMQETTVKAFTRWMKDTL